MVWNATDDDPRLLESKQFKGEAALGLWLAGIATRYGRCVAGMMIEGLIRSPENLGSLRRLRQRRPEPTDPDATDGTREHRWELHALDHRFESL